MNLLLAGARERLRAGIPAGPRLRKGVRKMIWGSACQKNEVHSSLVNADRGRGGFLGEG